MTDQPILSEVIDLDTPVQRGETRIAFVQMRKPGAGELRGLSLVDLGQLKVDALIKIIPRISIPTINEAEAANLDPADLLACGAAIGGFLLQKSQRAVVLDS
ncbi:hypothetical protein FHS51_001727 [Sphingobium wenxiniae]|uniref:Tail assembly chaperone E/41/14-like protein n=1 Tax=Sphingobium wenxiniae (strain DSM 21828 / CGMCC 1.7748 / JZ-1) TaxID=595605 RepID=A0A562KCR9_SPHWJ|nr:phage tail assembly protein [Sphingobium wenxiniae]MBB6191500.1 hypothetical protein [Sphingobium wenxiniae]TWH93210.1 tail assembly chaperone E/41/14-like protein [Sphingobium wenxiniae]